LSSIQLGWTLSVKGLSAAPAKAHYVNMRHEITEEQRDTGIVSRRERLRLATAAQHATLDAMISEANHFGTLAGYESWLRGSYEFHHAIAGFLCSAAHLPPLPLAPLTQRTELLAKDILAVSQLRGTASLNCHRWNGQAAERFPVLTCMAEALGILYVTEGAALGSRLLLLRAKTLGLSNTLGARHLAYAAQDLAPWRRMLRLLEDFAGSAEDDERMVAAAQSTFALAMNHMSAQR
jgi:heme oxygenase (biliverdin-IX-beta and delta-forming)